MHLEPGGGWRRRWHWAAVAVASTAAALLLAAASGSHQDQDVRLIVQFRTDAVVSSQVDLGPIEHLVVTRLSENRLEQLARLENLAIVAPQIAAAYRHRPVGELRDALGADVVLHASVLVVGPRLVLHAKLVRLDDSSLLWSMNREVDAGELTASYRGVAEEIAQGAIAALPVLFGPPNG
jgi:TolB-like protein